MPEANILGAVSAVVFCGLVVWVVLVQTKAKTAWALTEAERDALLEGAPLEEAPAVPVLAVAAAGDNANDEVKGDGSTGSDEAPSGAGSDQPADDEAAEKKNPA